MDPAAAATTAQVPPALRTKSKAYQTTIAAEADDLKYESKYKELRKKVKIVEEDNDQLYARILQAQHNIQRLRLERAIIYERVAQLGPPPAPQAAPPQTQEPPAGHQGGQGGHPPHGPPPNSGPQPHPLSQSFRAPPEQPPPAPPAPPQTHQRSHRPHPEDAPYPYQQARRHPEPPIDDPHYNRSRSPSVAHRRLYEGTPNQMGRDAKQPPPGPNYHPSPRQPADYPPRSHSRDPHGPRYPHDNQQGPPPQDRLPPIRVQERRMSTEQPTHGHPPPPSHGQHSERPSPVTMEHPSFPQANGHSQHIPQSTRRSSIHQGGPQPLANPYPERTGSHSSSSTSRHESRERHQKLRWEEPRRPPADSPQVEISPVRFAGDKMRMRSGAGEDGVYGSSAGGPMPPAPGVPRMEREAFNRGSVTNSPGVYRRDSMTEVSPVASPDGDMSRAQRMR